MLNSSSLRAALGEGAIAKSGSQLFPRCNLSSDRVSNSGHLNRITISDEGTKDIMPEYLTLPDLPGKKLFRCERLLATITTDSCSSMWKQANHDNVEARARCKVCPIGAVHAGENDANMSPLKGALICARCERPAPRLVGGIVCVSCKNREYEWVKGCNAKGSRPVKMAPLAPRCLRYMDGKEPCSIKRNLTKSTSELVIATLREARHRVAFGFASAIVDERQGRLFP